MNYGDSDFLWLWPQVATPDFTNFFACLGFIFFLSFCDCDSECTNLGPTNFWLWATPMTRYRAASRTRLASPHTQAKWIQVAFYLIIGRLRRGSRVRASYSLDLLREPTNFWFWLIWNRTIKILMVCKFDQLFKNVKLLSCWSTSWIMYKRTN